MSSNIALSESPNIYMRATPQKTESSSGGWALCSPGFPCYMNILGTHLHQCTSCHCCERLCLHQWIFLLSFYYICPNSPPLLCPALPTPTSNFPSTDSQCPPCSPCPLVIYICLLMRPFPFIPLNHVSSPLWPLTACFLFPCLWFYFPPLFVCSLVSSYRWDHMVFFSQLLAYFT